MNWLHYLIEANLYLAVFYIGYILVLSRETHYNLNRAYLLFSCVVSFILPVVQLGVLKPAVEPVTAVSFTLPLQAAIVDTSQLKPIEQPFNWDALIIYGYLAGVAILLLLLSIKLYQLFKLTKAESISSNNNYKLVYLNDSNSAFSFFNFLFIGTKAGGADTIIRHELVHIRQKHSADVIFIELLKIINWFNPFVYLLQNSLRAVHEYIADEQTAISDSDALAYSTFLVNNAYGLSGSSITHSFFNYNLLKKRIIMLHQKRSGSLARLKYLLAVPLCAGMLCASTLAFSKTYGWVDIGPHRINKNNTSPQVAEPVKRLLVTQHGVSVISDKFSEERQDGSIRFYTVKNLSNKDKVDLKSRGIIVNIISDVKIDSSKGKQLAENQATRVKFPLPNPMTTHTAMGYYYSEAVYNEKGYTDIVVTFKEKNGKYREFTKSKATPAEIALLKNTYGYVFPAHMQMPPPPPPAPHAPYTSSTSKNVQVQEYEYLYNNKIDFSVAIYKNNRVIGNYFKSQSSPANIQFLSEKYGYTFPANGKYELAHPKNMSALPVSAVRLVLPRTIPADPAAVSAPSPTAKMVTFPPPIVKDQVKLPPPVVKRDGKISPPVVIDQVKLPPPVIKPDGKVPPPPPPAPPVKPFLKTDTSKSPGEKLARQLGKTIRYPRIARDTNYGGRVIASFTVDNDFKAQDVWIPRGLDQSLNDETVRALKAIDVSGLKPGAVYSIPISFTIMGKDGKYVDVKVPDNAIAKTTNPHPGTSKSSITLNELVVTSYK